MKLNVQKTALMFATFAGVVHTIWSLLVALKYAQTYLDWMVGLHFLQNPFTVAPFNLTTAVALIAVTSALGYLVGFVFSTVWNRLNK
ncbi:hypothetical protein HY502_01540 [Candidatus Woesebacteria bacterium]|nr:hypothetical protein [Candidatus Woesebacteria bacterium]